MKKTFAILILISAFLCSCKKEVGIAGAAGPPGNPGPDGIISDTGSVSGKVSLYDEFSHRIDNPSGVSVTIKSGTLERTMLTDTTGSYIFRGLQMGTYNLSFQKTGFGTMKVFGVSHTPGSGLPTPVPDVYVLQTPVKTAIDSLHLIDQPSYVALQIYLDTSSFSYQEYYLDFVVLIGKTADLNTSNALISYFSSLVLPNGNGGYSVIIYKSDLGGDSYSDGPYYVRAGTYNHYLYKTKDPGSSFDPGLASSFVDPDDGQTVFPNLKLSKDVLKLPN